MRAPLVLALTCTLLAACGTTPATQKAQTAPTPDMIAQANKVAVLSVKVDPDARYLTAILTPTKKGEPQTLTAAPANGTALFRVNDVSAGEYTAVISAYDNQDRQVMLYESTSTVSLKKGVATQAPDLTRVTATVTVNATPTLAVTSAYTATIGSTTLPMTVSGDAATVTFPAMPTARGVTVTVKGTTADGQTSQSGTATFNLTRGGATVPVTLSAQAICAVVPITGISAVQGSGAVSPLAGQSVTVRGTVTADYQSGLKGFMLQDAGDNDATTSDGVFVYTGAAPQAVAAGDTVQVTAVVKEFGTGPNTLTELDTLTGFAKCNSGQVIKPVEIKAPFSDLERFEGMLVTYPGTLTITDNFPYGRFGELGLSATGRQFNPTNGNVASPLTQAELLASRILLDDAVSAQNPNPQPYLSAERTRRTGDTVTGLTGTLHFANGAFKIEPVGTVPFVAANPQPAAPKPVGGTLKVAGANVLNYFTTLGSAGRGASNAVEFDRQKTKVVNALRGLDADIVTLMEVENNGDTALNDLVAALNTAYGTGETYRAIQTGVIGTDAIKVAMLYKPATVKPLGAFVVDTNSVYSRPPLAQTFQKLTGGTVTIIANHFKSKGSCPTSGDIDTGQGCWNTLRVQQAQAVTAFAETLKTRVNDGDVLIMGDLNAYGAEDPIRTIEGQGYESLNLRVPAEDRYSYQFGGLFGYLDHALASTPLSAQVTGITEWHINSDEPVTADYNVEFKATAGCTTSCNGDDLYNAATPFRASDHDPVLVGLDLAQDNPTDPGVTPLTVTATGSDTATTGQPYSLATATTGTPDSVTVTWGDGTAPQPVTASPTTHTYAATGTFTITVTATRGAETKTATKTVNVSAAPVGGGVYFSEYVEGTSNNKAIEIYNGTGATVPGGSIVVRLYSNGGVTAGASFTVATDLPTGATYVIANSQATSALLALSQATSGVTNFNGDDALELLVNGVRADTFGQIGVDPGTAWTGGGVSTIDRTLRRAPSVTSGDPDGSDAFDPSVQWVGFATDTFDGLGTR